MASVLGAVGRIDVCTPTAGVRAHVFDSDPGLEARDADSCLSGFEDVPEPAGIPSIPGPHVHLLAHADDPDRRPTPRRPVGTLSGDLQFLGPTDPVELVRRPGGGDDVNSSAVMAVRVVVVARGGGGGKGGGGKGWWWWCRFALARAGHRRALRGAQTVATGGPRRSRGKAQSSVPIVDEVDDAAAETATSGRNRNPERDPRSGQGDGFSGDDVETTDTEGERPP